MILKDGITLRRIVRIAAQKNDFSNKSMLQITLVIGGQFKRFELFYLFGLYFLTIIFSKIGVKFVIL